MKKAIAVMLVTVLVAGCALGPRRIEGDAAAVYADYAGDPVKGFTAFRLQSWQPLSRDRLILWNGVNEAYLVTVTGPCQDLQFAEAIRVTRTGSQVTTFDQIRVGRDRCLIEQIRPIDVRQMKADRAADAADR